MRLPSATAATASGSPAAPSASRWRCHGTPFWVTEGTSKKWERVADSGNVSTQHFCDGCGTRLYTEPRSMPHLVTIRAGTLDEQPG